MDTGTSQVSPVKRIFYTEVGNGTGLVDASAVTISTSPKRIDFAVKIPKREALMSSKSWLRHYSLAKLKLDLNSIVNTTQCLQSQNKRTGAAVPRHCTVLPTVTIHGVRKHLHIPSSELEKYEKILGSVLKRYLSRIKWLQSGSRRIFGCVLESNVVFLVDVSGSMAGCFGQLKHELSRLLWDQLQEHKINFNLVAFSSGIKPWSDVITAATNKACQDAKAWLDTVECTGGTSTLDALRFAYKQKDVEGIYLLTDGKPDTSMASILQEVKLQNDDQLHQVKIHTISFNCSDNSCNVFLRSLASATKGRYHNITLACDEDGVQQQQQLALEKFDSNHASSLQGDDLEALARETALCRKYMLQSQEYRDAILNQQRTKS